MQKVITRATFAICTLSIGVALSLLANKYRSQSVTPADIPAVKLKMVPYFTEGWRRVDIDRNFSFYLPQTMTTDLPRGHWGFPEGGSFSDSALNLSYTYSVSLSCEPNLFIPKFGAYQNAEVIIAGKSARLEKSARPPGDQFSLTLCFPDIGDHQTKLRLSATAGDTRALNVARQIFDSIEFH